MNETTRTPAAAEQAAGHPDDIARRVVSRCRQLGLGQDEVAARAGMSPRYLGQLLDFGPGFDPGAVFRLARVLGVSRADLVEGRADAPPGRAPGAARARMLRLTEQECWDRLGTHGVGRLALPGERFPLVLPVNYTVDGTTVAYRTADFGAAAAAVGDGVAFEVDRIDEHRSSGWSVLLGGRAERVQDPEAERRLVELAVGEPWAGGHRTLWIRVVPESVTGRVVGPADGRDGGAGP